MQKYTAEQVVIRRVEPGDAAQMQRVTNGRGAYSGTLQLPYASERIWQDRLAAHDANAQKTAQLLVAEVEGRVVGHAGLHLEGNLRRRHAAHFGIWVDDEFAGRGIGSLLTQAVLDLADNWLNVLRIELTVFVDNHAAQKMYIKHGFVQEGVLRAYAMRDGQLMDVWTMARLHPRQALLPNTVML